MVARIVKCIEDLAHLNQYRVTRTNVNDSRRFAQRCEETMENMLANLSKHDAGEDIDSSKEVQAMIDEAIKGFRKVSALAWERQTQEGLTMDAVFARLVERMQPVKEALLKNDPTAWTKVFGSVPSEQGTCESGEIAIQVETMGGNHLRIMCTPGQTLAELKSQLFKCGGPRPVDQKIVINGDMHEDDHTTLEGMGVADGSSITLICAPYCEICQGHCACADCHGEGRYGDGCCTCGKVRPSCPQCGGPCKCTQCHGSGRGRGCRVCGIRPPCWGGDTYVLLPDGSAKKVRECGVGDEVRTLLGSKRISRVWGRDPNLPQNVDTEVCCINGVWITSHHPVISGGEWVYPADIKATAPWRKRMHVVPDMFNFELEGHDDTILLWGGGDDDLLVSCTIGKYLGPRFGNGICTRRSTRCQHECRQCDSVYVEGFLHNRIPSEWRWSKFPDFPQVEWEDAVSEFELAAEASRNFVPPRNLSHATCAEEERATLCGVCMPRVSALSVS